MSSGGPFCGICGADNDTYGDCPRCQRWWADNPPPSEDATMTPPKSPPQPAVSVEQIDPKAEYAAFKIWAAGRFPDRETPAVTSHLFDAWMGSARHRLSAAPPAAKAPGVVVARSDIEQTILAELPTRRLPFDRAEFSTRLSWRILALHDAAPPADGVLRALQAQEDAEDAREACPDCEGEGQWEHCSICSLNFGRVIDLRRAALAGTSMAAFGASEAACYHYPGAHQQAERTAFCHGSEYASAAPKAPTAPIGEAARPGREEIAEAVGSLLDDRIHAEARRRHLADATQSGYEHHLIRVAGEMAITRFCARAALDQPQSGEGGE